MRLSLIFEVVKKSFLYTLGVAILFYSSLTFAASSSDSTPDAATMLENFATTVPQLMTMLTAMAYVIGMYLIVTGLFRLREYGEQRSMMSSQHDLKAPLALIITGTMLLYIPSSVQVGLNTFWKDPNPYEYAQETSDQWSTLYQDIFLVVQLVGTIAFIRGILILSKMSRHQGQGGEFGKGITYIIAGIFCINLYGFLTVINTTLGLTGVVPLP